MLIAALQNPALYDHPVERFEVVVVAFRKDPEPEGVAVGDALVLVDAVLGHHVCGEVGKVSGAWVSADL